MKALSLALFIIALVMISPVSHRTASAQSSGDALLPQLTVDTSMPNTAGYQVTNVAAGDAAGFQSALNSATRNPGTIINLQAGSTYTGNFTLPFKSGTGWTVIQSSNLAGLPAPRNRVSPSSAAAMPRIESPNFAPALKSVNAANAQSQYYRFIGIEITAAASITSMGACIAIGDGANFMTSVDQAPHHIIFDRCYIHGHSNLSARRGIMANAAHFAVIDSYLSEWRNPGFDAQAMAGWNGEGPFKIENNFLEGSGENVMFGGSDPASVAMIPSDITIRRNHFFKRLSWRGSPNGIKNLFELKVGKRVLVEGNILENCWRDAQNGYAIVIKSVNQDGRASWSVTEDVSVRNNVVRHVNPNVAKQTQSCGVAKRDEVVEQCIFCRLVSAHGEGESSLRSS